MQSSSYTDKLYEIDKSLLYSMSIQISLDGLSFAILDLPNGKYIKFKHYPLFTTRPSMLAKLVRDIIEKDEALQKEYKSLSIKYITSCYSIVPDQLIESGVSIDSILEMSNDIEPNSLVLSSKIDQFNSSVIYSIPSTLVELIESSFYNYDLDLHIPSIIKVISENRDLSEGVNLISNHHKGGADLILIKDNQLLSGTFYPLTQNIDLLYSSLYMIKQFNIEQKECNLVAMGNISKLSSVMFQIRRYIKDLSFAKNSKNYSYSNELSGVAEHQYQLVLNLR